MTNAAHESTPCASTVSAGPGAAWPGMVRHGEVRLGLSESNTIRASTPRGSANGAGLGQAWHGVARRGTAGHGRFWRIRDTREHSPCVDHLGPAAIGLAWLGAAWQCAVRRGEARALREHFNRRRT